MARVEALPGTTRKKGTAPVDVYVGARVRMRRLMMDMSQEKLGTALGLTFQQVQKYEKGANRIGASRLQQISEILQVPVAYFFEGWPSDGGAPTKADRSELSDIAQFMASSDGVELMRAFIRIANPKLRRQLARLAVEIANQAH